MRGELALITAEGLHLYASLYTRVFNAPPWNDGWSDEGALERLVAFTLCPKFRGLALWDGPEPIALVLGWGERWVNGWVFHVKEMCVSQSHQRQGFGKVLLDAFEVSLAKENFTGVYLQTGRSAPAKDFYQSSGYSELPIVSLKKRFFN